MGKDRGGLLITALYPVTELMNHEHEATLSSFDLSAVCFVNATHLSICVRPLLLHGPNVYR